MDTVVSAADMNWIDRYAQEQLGIPAAVLMEHAGVNAWQILRNYLLPCRGSPSTPLRVVYIAGKGNNGGDAAVMARASLQEAEPIAHAAIIDCALPQPDRSGSPDAPPPTLCEQQKEICRRIGIEVVQWGTSSAYHLLDEADWIVDGLLGSGIVDAARQEAAEIIAHINEHYSMDRAGARRTGAGTRVCALDIPSGIGDRYRAGMAAVTADITIAMECIKRCCYGIEAQKKCGKIYIARAGFPSAVFDAIAHTDHRTSQAPQASQAPRVPRSASQVRLAAVGRQVSPADLCRFVVPISPTVHKYQRGLVELYAGSPSMIGAARMAAEAALASGAGLVHLYTDSEVLSDASIAIDPAVIVKPDTAPFPSEHAAHAMVVGPGWGRTPRRAQLLRSLFTRAIPGVLDADGVVLLAQLIEQTPERADLRGICKNRWVLTPHAAEWDRLAHAIPSEESPASPRAENKPRAGSSSHAAELDDIIPSLLHAADWLQAVVVRKGAKTIIVAPMGDYTICDAENPALATAGSGDVLAGICGTMAAQMDDIYHAACTAVLTHACAGERAFHAQGWITASHLIPHLAKILGEISKGAYGSKKI